MNEFAPESTRQVLLVRHGHSLCNAGQPSPGLGLSGLSPEGQLQAQALSAAINTAPDLIAVSPFRRAVETAAPLLARFPTSKVEEWPVQELTSLPSASFCGTTQNQRVEHTRAYFERCDPLFRTGEGAETFAEFIERADTMLDELKARTEKLIVVVTHGHFLQAALWRLLQPHTPIDSNLMKNFSAWRGCFPMSNVQVFPLQITSDGQIWLGPTWNPTTNPTKGPFD